MANSLSWLHFSDIHLLDKHDWRNSPVLDKLIADIGRLKASGLSIDLVFCTGDIGFGQTSADPLADQYAVAKDFFDKVLRVCALPKERFFLVPGNHDIDRKKVLPSQTKYFRDHDQTPDNINQMFRDHNDEVNRAMERLAQYRDFIQANYPHIPLDNNTTFGKPIPINGLNISIFGLNSAWTCAGDGEKSQLWLAGEAQLHTCGKAIKAEDPGYKADLCIALMHHPLSWLNPAEFQALRGRIQNECDFLLHGHEHDAWVDENSTPYHIVIAAGAVAAETKAEFGYNLVQLGPGKADIHLRHYNRKGDGWTKEIIAGRAEDGVWKVTPPSCDFGPPDPPPAASAPLPVPNPPPASPAPLKYFGLDDMLARCTKSLEGNPLLVVYGLAGVGKTVLIDALHHQPRWHGLKHLSVSLLESTGINDFFGQLANHLELHAERPRPPTGTTVSEIADGLRRIAPRAEPFFLHIQRGQHWFEKGRWRNLKISHLLQGLTRAYPGSIIALETRERPEAVACLEAGGLPKSAIAEYLADPPGMKSPGWSLRRQERDYIFQRLGGGHGRGAHAYGLTLLVQLAVSKDVDPYRMLKLEQYASDYAEALYEKLFHDLYQEVLTEVERRLLFACALYRNGVHYSHLPRLENAVLAPQGGDTLIRRRLLTEDDDWFFLHDLAIEQARRLAESEAQTQAWHRAIAGFWLDDIRGQRQIIEPNVRRALEAFYHLEQAGEGERVAEIAPELLGRRPDETHAMLWRLEEQFNRAGTSEKVCSILEYLLKVAPDDHKAMRFLGEYRQKLYGRKDSKALSLFREATRINPGFPQYWANYGNAAIAAGGEALRSFLAELETAPPRAVDDHVAAVQAKTLEATGRGEEASKLRRAKIEAGSRNAVFYTDEARWLLDAHRDAAGALAVLDWAARLGCANEYTEAIRAKTLEATGRGEEASKLRRAKIEAGSHHAAFYNDEARWLLDAHQDAAGALVLLDRAERAGCADVYTEAIRASALKALGKDGKSS